MALISTLTDPFVGAVNTSLWLDTGNQLQSQVTYDWTNSAGFTKVKSYAHDLSFYAFLDGSNYLVFYTASGTLYWARNAAGSFANGSVGATSNPAFTYLRIRTASGTTFWETSPNSVTWTSAHSETNPIAVTGLYAILQVGSGFVPTGGSGHFDSFNVAAASVPSGGAGNFFQFFTMSGTSAPGGGGGGGGTPLYPGTKYPGTVYPGAY